MSLWLRLVTSFLAYVMSFLAKLLGWLVAVETALWQPVAVLHDAALGAGPLWMLRTAGCAKP